MRKIDITGKRFSRLTAVRPTKRRDAKGSVIWECRCDCGSKVYYSVNYLNRKGARSCGCLYRESRPSCVSMRNDMIESTMLSQLASAKKVRSDNSSGCTGVSWDKNRRKWCAYIGIKKKRHRLGQYDTYKEAVDVRKKAERILHDPLLFCHWDSLTENSKAKIKERTVFTK